MTPAREVPEDEQKNGQVWDGATLGFSLGLGYSRGLLLVLTRVGWMAYP